MSLGTLLIPDRIVSEDCNRRYEINYKKLETFLNAVGDAPLEKREIYEKLRGAGIVKPGILGRLQTEVMLIATYDSKDFRNFLSEWRFEYEIYYKFLSKKIDGKRIYKLAQGGFCRNL